MVKKIVLASLHVLILTMQLHAGSISLNNVRQSVVQIADRYLLSQGFPVSDIPARLMTEYYQKIDSVIDSLNQQAFGKNYLDEKEVYSAVYYQFSKFSENLRTVVLAKNVETTVTNIVQEEFRIQNISVSSLPSSMTQEFQNRRQTIVRRLRNIMQVDGRDYIRTNEIERIVKEEMTVLIHRAKKQIQDAQKPDAGFNFWNFLFGETAPKPEEPSTPFTNESSRIKSFYLEAKVLDVVNKQLAQQGVDTNNVPSRVIADYSQSIQRALSGLRERMQNHGRDYVTIAEIELFVSQKLKSVIDKIKLVGQSCSICLDGYFSREIIGNLQCGHIFHKQCISTWFAHKQTCPDCNQKNAKIVEQEIVI